MVTKQMYQKLNVILMTLGLIALSVLLAGYAFAQEAITVTDQGWEANFREHLTFTMSAESAAEIVEADLFYQVVGQIASSRNEADFTPGVAIEARFEIDQSDPANYFPPGTELQYWWKIVDTAGNELKTEKESLTYLDNRYDWKSLTNERLTLYWYEGDDGFGQSLFERANVALDTLETDVGIALENPIRIFIYGNHQDLLGSLRASAQEWTGGVAFTEYGVVLIGIHPQQLDWGLNAMTHEMSHLVIHQVTDNPFGDLPRWLDEGIAVYNENRDELDQDFLPLFERAIADDELMTLRTLSSPFPADPMLANLAYGQSGEMVRYIINSYGSEAMAELLQIFAEGALYDEALQQALGVDTDGLDNEFRVSLDLPPLPGAEEAEPEVSQAVETDLSAEVSREEEAESGESVAETEELSGIVEETVESAEAVQEVVPTATSVEVAVVKETSEQAANQAAEAETVESERSGASALPCLAGLLPLAAIGLVFVTRRQA